MGKPSRDKGARAEREIVERHKAIGLDASRVPLSGAAGGRYSGDIDIPLWGADQPVAVAEVKARGSGQGFVTLERWLGKNDLLFLRRDRAAPLVVLPWETYARLVGRKEPT